MDKVIIPKEVAEAIETLRRDLDDVAIIVAYDRYLSNSTEYHPEAVKKLLKIGHEKLMKSLVIGWEVEVTPEEKIKKSYDGFLNSSMEPFEYGLKEHEWFQLGIRTTLNILGKKIKGVNTDA